MSLQKTSVALCTYNGSKYIEEQLSSIINQTVRVDEIIVCDDRSDDNTLDVVRKIVPEAIKITIFENEKQLGVIKNFEKAITNCSGDVILLSDQDDVWIPDKVQKTLDFFRKNPRKSVVFTNGRIINSANNFIGNKTLFDCVNLGEKGLYWWNKGYEFDILCIANRITGATVAFKSEMKKYLLPFDKTDDNVLHDWQIAIKSAEKKTIGILTDCLILYRLHENQQTTLSKWLENPLPIEINHPLNPNHEVGKIICGKTNISRFRFIEKRHAYAHRKRGLLLCIISFFSYGKYYKSDLFSFLLGDLKTWFENYC